MFSFLPKMLSRENILFIVSFIIITRLSAKDTNGVMKIPDGLSLLSVSCYSFPAILAYYTARGGE